MEGHNERRVYVTYCLVSGKHFQAIRILLCENTEITYLLISSFLRADAASRRSDRNVAQKTSHQDRVHRMDAQALLPRRQDDIAKRGAAIGMDLMNLTLALYEDCTDKVSKLCAMPAFWRGFITSHGLPASTRIWSCKRCVAELNDKLLKLRNVYPNIYHYGRELLRIGMNTLPFEREVTGII